MATDLTTQGEVEVRAGDPLDSAEAAKVAAWIVIASALIRSAVPTVDERMASGELDPALVRGIASEVVVRALHGDRIGFRVRSEQFPEVRTDYRDTDNPLLYLLDAERRLLDPPVQRPRRAFSVFPRLA